jgi:hypothetical protein
MASNVGFLGVKFSNILIDSLASFATDGIKRVAKLN